MKYNTQKIHKKKAEEAGLSMSNNKNLSLSNSKTRSVRKKSSQKMYAKMTDSNVMPASADFVPQHLEHRQSQQLAQTNVLTFGQVQQNQQRTQSNPNNRVTAFIKIQHMPAEILLQQQKTAPLQHNHTSQLHQHVNNNPHNHLMMPANVGINTVATTSTGGCMRGHHLNAMMAQ